MTPPMIATAATTATSTTAVDDEQLGRGDAGQNNNTTSTITSGGKKDAQHEPRQKGQQAGTAARRRRKKMHTSTSKPNESHQALLLGYPFTAVARAEEQSTLARDFIQRILHVISQPRSAGPALKLAKPQQPATGSDSAMLHQLQPPPSTSSTATSTSTSTRIVTATNPTAVELPKSHAHEYGQLFVASLSHTLQHTPSQSQPDTPLSHTHTMMGDTLDQNTRKEGAGTRDAPATVFLGGACNPTTWRMDIAMPYLEQHGVQYYNPQVSEWHEGLIAIEKQAKDTAHVLLFVINSQTRGIATLVEVATLVTQKRTVVLCISGFKKGDTVVGEALTDDEIEETNRARKDLEMLVRAAPNCFITDTVEEAAALSALLIKQGAHRDSLETMLATNEQSPALSPPTCGRVIAHQTIAQHPFSKYLTTTDKVLVERILDSAMALQQDGFVQPQAVVELVRDVVGVELTLDSLQGFLSNHSQLTDARDRVSDADSDEATANTALSDGTTVAPLPIGCILDVVVKASAITTASNSAAVSPKNGQQTAASSLFFSAKLATHFGHAFPDQDLKCTPNEPDAHADADADADADVRDAPNTPNAPNALDTVEGVDSNSRADHGCREEGHLTAPLRRAVCIVGTHTAPADVSRFLAASNITFYDTTMPADKSGDMSTVWTPDLVAFQLDVARLCNIVLIHIPSTIRGTSELVEAAHLVTAATTRVVVCLQDCDDATPVNGKHLPPLEIKDLNRGRAYLRSHLKDCANGFVSTDLTECLAVVAELSSSVLSS